MAITSQCVRDKKETKTMQLVYWNKMETYTVIGVRISTIRFAKH